VKEWKRESLEEEKDDRSDKRFKSNTGKRRKLDKKSCTKGRYKLLSPIKFDG
jgi:hypothetical protein